MFDPVMVTRSVCCAPACRLAAQSIAVTMKAADTAREMRLREDSFCMKSPSIRIVGWGLLQNARQFNPAFLASRAGAAAMILNSFCAAERCAQRILQAPARFHSPRCEHISVHSKSSLINIKTALDIYQSLPSAK
jgi:hypothetical protein